MYIDVLHMYYTHIDLFLNTFIILASVPHSTGHQISRVVKEKSHYVQWRKTDFTALIELSQCCWDQKNDQAGFGMKYDDVISSGEK